MISMPLTRGFSTWCSQVRSTDPSLVVSNDFIVPMSVPGLADRSTFGATVVPSSWIEKMRWPADAVPGYRLAR